MKALVAVVPARARSSVAGQNMNMTGWGFRCCLADLLRQDAPCTETSIIAVRRVGIKEMATGTVNTEGPGSAKKTHLLVPPGEGEQGGVVNVFHPVHPLPMQAKCK